MFGPLSFSFRGKARGWEEHQRLSFAAHAFCSDLLKNPALASTGLTASCEDGRSVSATICQQRQQQHTHRSSARLQIQAAYTLFQDGRNTGLTKKGFQAQMHDKFAVVLSQKVQKRHFYFFYIHYFCLLLMSPCLEPAVPPRKSA